MHSLSNQLEIKINVVVFLKEERKPLWKISNRRKRGLYYWRHGEKLKFNLERNNLLNKLIVNNQRKLKNAGRYKCKRMNKMMKLVRISFH